MAGLIGRKKLDRDENAARLVAEGLARVYTLTCVTDGSKMPFLDEGPFPIHGPNWQSIDPSGGRQRLLAILDKKDDQGRPVWACELAKGEKAPEPVWNKAIRQFVKVPIAGADFRDAFVEHSAVRADMAEKGRAAMKRDAAQKAEELSVQKAIDPSTTSANLAEKKAPKPAPSADG